MPPFQKSAKKAITLFYVYIANSVLLTSIVLLFYEVHNTPVSILRPAFLLLRCPALPVLLLRDLAVTHHAQRTEVIQGAQPPTVRNGYDMVRVPELPLPRVCDDLVQLRGGER